MGQHDFFPGSWADRSREVLGRSLQEPLQHPSQLFSYAVGGGLFVRGGP